MIDEVEGIILKETSYGESSKIIHVFTKDRGIIGVMAKGAKTMKSSLRSLTDRLTYGIFHIRYKKDKLSNLSSVDLLNNFRNIKTDITKISYASFLLELSEQVARQNMDEDIFTTLISALEKINEGFDCLVITNIVELKYLEKLGVMPIIDECCICGNTTNIATLSSVRGGYVCKNCLTNETLVSEKTIKLIRMFYYVDIKKISKIDISNISKIEINQFLDEYYDTYTGLYLKSKSFINNLKKIVVSE